VFWYLLFAHLISDFPLQPTWMVMNKTRFGVLFLHVTIHFFVSLVFVFLIAREVWPFLVLLALIHFLIDTGKNYLNEKRPNWVVGPYIFDQILHISSIYFIAVLLEINSGIPPFALGPVWLIILIAYLFVTYIWYISERIIVYKNAAYFQQVVDKEWSRMLTRALFLTLSLIAWMNLSSLNVFMVGIINFPYRKKAFGIRALLTDLAISLGGAFFIIWIA